MKAISLWQPWAQAIILGEKAIETRSWLTRYRGPLVIHAAKRWQWEQVQKLRESGMQTDGLPLGMLMATCVLHDCIPTEEAAKICDERELFWGDYTPGRWAWMLTEIKPVPMLREFSGKQGFFDVPDALLSCI